MQETCLPAFSISKIGISGEDNVEVGVFKWKPTSFEVCEYILLSFLKNKSTVIPIVTKSSYYFHKVVSDWKLERVWGCVVIRFEIVKR